MWDELLLFEARSGYGRYHVTPALLDGTKRVVKRALALPQYECGMTVHQLAAWMISIGMWEVPSIAVGDVARKVTISGQPKTIEYTKGDNMRHPARSLMTLSRADYYDPNPDDIPERRGREHNYRLYPDDDKSWPETRAFWNPGVGHWQLDNWPLDMSHAERAHIDKGGFQVAKELVRVCDQGDADGNDMLDFDEYIIRIWHACKWPLDEAIEKKNCHRTYRGVYMGTESLVSADSLYVTTADNAADVDLDGGVQSMGLGGRGCRWGMTGERFDCWFYDTDNPEGHTASDLAADDVTGTRLTSPNPISPLAAPFMSFTHGDRRYAVFPGSFTGDTVTWIKYAPVGRLARSVTANTWTQDTKSGISTGDRLMVLICSADASSEYQDCDWESASEHDENGSFSEAMRARFP